MTAASPLRQADFLDDFHLPEDLEATSPPEMRGLRRDGVRLMIHERGEVRHRRFDEISEELEPGDLLVINNSRTIPAAVPVDDSTMVHFSTRLAGGFRVVELRHRTSIGSEPNLSMSPGTMALPDGSQLLLLAPFPVDSPTRRLWTAHIEGGDGLRRLLEQHGRPISYTHSASPLPLSSYQTVFATEDGSAEMPSAARPFSVDLVTALIARGVVVAPLTLHTGVSSLETGEPPYPEWYSVPDATADLVNDTRERGHRVVAVGTTVVRALATVTDSHGRVNGGGGWTDLVIEPTTPVDVISGLITGWHEPRSTHLDMLVAFAGRDAVVRSYEEALRLGYLWHEFGDSHLIL